MDSFVDNSVALKLSLLPLAINLLASGLFGLLIGWHFRRFARFAANAHLWVKNFVFLTMITTLVIGIIKSSLALSLGLVGALSIVRFRTLIKEPEELIYLFFAIAIGVGFGAEQTVPTIAAGVTILIFTAFVGRRRSLKQEGLSFLNLKVAGDKFADISAIMAELQAKKIKAELVRIDSQEKSTEALVRLGSGADFAEISRFLRERFSGTTFSMIEGSGYGDLG